MQRYDNKYIFVISHRPSWIFAFFSISSRVRSLHPPRYHYIHARDEQSTLKKTLTDKKGSGGKSLFDCLTTLTKTRIEAWKLTMSKSALKSPKLCSLSQFLQHFAKMPHELTTSWLCGAMPSNLIHHRLTPTNMTGHVSRAPLCLYP